MCTINVEQSKVISLYNQADEKGKELLKNLVGDQLSFQKITDRVQTFDDILQISGCTLESLINKNDSADEIAYKKAKLIAFVYNEGTVLDPNNKKQNKYFPWFEITPGSGFGLSYDVCDSWASRASVGVRLCFKDGSLAKDAGQKFPDIYAALLIN